MMSMQPNHPSSASVASTASNTSSSPALATTNTNGIGTSTSTTTTTLSQRLFASNGGSLGSVFRMVLQIYWDSRQARFLIGLAALSLVPATIALMIVVQRIVNNVFGTTDVNDPRFFQKNFLGIFLILMTRLLLHQGVGILSEGAICFAAADICLGRSVRPSAAALRMAFVHRVWTLMGAGLLCFVAIFVGYLLFFVVGLYVVVTLYLTVPAIVLESHNQRQQQYPWDGLLRSMEMTRDKQVFFLTCHVILLLTQSLVAHLLNSLLLSGNNNHGGLFSVWGTLVAMIPNMLFVPAFAILKTVLYLRVRVETEGLTADQLAQEMGQGQQLLGGGDGGPDYRQLAFHEEDAGSGPLIVPAPPAHTSSFVSHTATATSQQRLEEGSDLSLTAVTATPNIGQEQQAFSVLPPSAE